MGSRRCNCSKNKLNRAPLKTLSIKSCSRCKLMDAQGRIDLEKRLAGRSGLSVALESTVTFFNLLSAIGGNLLVCWTIFKHPRLRSTSNIFIACLALSDVFIAVLGFPFTLAVLLTGRWPFNKAACNFQGFTFTVFGTFSLVTMTLTAIARYFKVTGPSLHPKIYSKRNIYMSLSDCSVFNVNAIPDIFNVQRRIFLSPWKIHLYLRLRQVKPCRMSLNGNISNYRVLWTNSILSYLYFSLCSTA